MSVKLKKKSSNWKTDEEKYKQLRKKFPKGIPPGEFKKVFPSGQKTPPSHIKYELESEYTEKTSSKNKKSKSKSKKEVATKLLSRDVGSDKGAFKNVYERREVTKGKGGKVKVKSRGSKAQGFTYKGVGLLDEVRVSADPKRDKELKKKARIKLRRKKKDIKYEKKQRKAVDKYESKRLTEEVKKRYKA